VDPPRSMPSARSGRATMPDGLVLDSSAALSVVLAEPATGRVRDALERTIGEPIRVLDLFWLEVVNVLVRRHGWDADAVVEAVRELDVLGLETVPLDRPLLLAALDIAVPSGMTAYDAAHLALAEAADSRLLTLDADLAHRAGTRAALPVERGTRESAVPYDPEPAPPDWTRHGRYLAELRRAAGI
jgi:predicted nucleic acid-binding protein